MRRFFVGRAVVVLALAAGGVFVWLLFLAGGSGEPSTDLTTPTIPEAGSTTTTDGASGTTQPSNGGVQSFVIDQARSVATYEIDENLRGSFNRVVGTTDQIAGRLQVDPSDLSTVTFSQIVVNARTFQTDSARRDQAVRGPIILNSGSDEHEFITFDVTSVDGLNGPVDVGGTVEFTVAGDLTIRGTTSTEIFVVVVTYADQSTIRGEATTTVLRSVYGIGIPNVPGVTNVRDEVRIKLEFVAVSG